jgi:polysaccharide biosynthesis protein PslG
MPSFARVIREAYAEILEREPDPGGLTSFDRLMNQGLSEASLRESLLRSREFALRYPDASLPSRLGMNVHVPSNLMLDDVGANLGIPWVRLDFNWFQIEPEAGVFRWEEHDRVVARAAALGLQVLATLAYTPAWASTNPANPRISDPPASTFWRDFVAQALSRFQDRVRHWQFWNEPNITEFWTGSMTQYRSEILEPAAAVARAIDPTLQVVSPGLANLRDWRDWFREALKAGDSIDVINHHSYASSGREAIVNLERDTPLQPSLRTLIRELGAADKPFWLTETGRRSDASNQSQPQYYEDILIVLQEKDWVDRLFFFHYTDGPGQGNGGFGIVNEDLSPKPAYRVLQSVLRSAGLSVG